MQEKINSISNTSSQKLISDLVFGTIAQSILNDVKKIAPIKRIEIVKSRILSKK